LLTIAANQVNPRATLKLGKVRTDEAASDADRKAAANWFEIARLRWHGLWLLPDQAGEPTPRNSTQSLNCGGIILRPLVFPIGGFFSGRHFAVTRAHHPVALESLWLRIGCARNRQVLLPQMNTYN